MSPITNLSVLAFASAALATPFHGHGHARHHHAPSGHSAVPYGAVNGTGIYGSGTGFATGSTASSTAVPSDAPTNVAPSPVGPATASESAVTTYTSVETYFNAASGTTCTTDVTITSKTKVYVTVTVPAAGESSASDVESASQSTSEASSSRPRSTVRVTNTITQPRASSTVESSTAAAPVESSSAESTSQAASVETSSSAAPPTYAAPASSSSTQAAPVQTSSSVAPPAYAAPASTSSTSSTQAAPVETSSSAAPPAYTAPTSSSSSEAAPISMTYSEVNKGAVASSTSSAAAAYSSTASTSSGKRGVAYNDAALTDCFLNKPQVSWAYNWGSASQGLNKAYAYIPMLWSTRSDFTGYWDTNVKAALAAGSSHIFSFNEPDLSSQANLSPQDAAAGFKQYIQPYAGQAKLCAPAVTNGGGSMGLTWLSEFLSACDGCTIDCVNIHWYDSADHTDYFKDQVKNATDVSGGKQVFISEFGATGSDDEVSTFLQDVMPWMDSQSYVEGYAYFMVTDGKLVSGTEPSSYGAVYAGSA